MHASGFDSAKYTWTRFDCVPQEGIRVVQNVTHVPLVSFCERLGNIFKVSKNPSHLFKKLMLGFVTHAPKMAKGSTPRIHKIQKC